MSLSLTVQKAIKARVNKTKIILTHLNLETESHVNDMKAGWSWAASCLKLFLETGRRISYDEWISTKYAE